MLSSRESKSGDEPVSLGLNLQQTQFHFLSLNWVLYYSNKLKLARFISEFEEDSSMVCNKFTFFVVFPFVITVFR